MSPTRPSAFSLLVVSVACLSGCVGGGGPDDGALDRATFIDTYVDLRATALSTETGELSDALRAEVLERHGVSEDAMTGFVETHGQDVAFMQEVWDEIEVRLDSTHPPADTVPEG